MASQPASAFSGELLDQLLSGRDPSTVFESGGPIGDLKKALAERMLNAEMDFIWTPRVRLRPAIIATGAAPRPC